MNVKELFDLTGKVALVTGGSSGPGLEIAELPWPGESTPVALYTRREVSLSPAQRWFRSLTLEAVSSGEFEDDGDDVD